MKRKIKEKEKKMETHTNDFFNSEVFSKDPAQLQHSRQNKLLSIRAGQMGDGNEEMQVTDWTPCVSHPNSVTPSRQLRPPHGPKHGNMQPGPRAQQIHGGSSSLVAPSGEGNSIPQPHGSFTSHSFTWI